MQAALGDQAARSFSIISESSHCVFRTIVVPRHTVMGQKREELASVFHQPLPVALCYLRTINCIRQGSKESIDILTVLTEVSLLQSIAIDGRHNCSQQMAEVRGDGLEFLVPWVTQ